MPNVLVSPRQLVVTIVLCLNTYGALYAQAGANAQPSVIRGTVIDSIHGGFLEDAYVELRPSGRQTSTNAMGAFVFDRVPPGTSYRIRVMHAVLDTLGLSLETPPFAMAAGQTTTLEISVPPPERVLSMLCSETLRSRGPAALVGFVRDPDTGRAIDSVSLSLVFDESPITSVHWMSNRVAHPDATGHFVICGLPGRVDGRLQLTRLGESSADIPVAIGDESPLTMRSFGWSLATRRAGAGVDSAGKRLAVMSGSATVRGRVVRKTGEPVQGANVHMSLTTASAITGADGSFTLGDVPAGTQLLTTRKIGYAEATQAVDVSIGESRPVRIVLGESVPVLAPVVTTSDRTSDLGKVGFARRKEQGLGFFLEGDQIDKGPPSLGESLRMIPGLHIGYDAQNQQQQKTIVMSSRDPSHGCVRYYVDGVYFDEIGGDIEKLVRPKDVEALEMYNPASVPSEFARASRGKCSVLVLWTNHMIRPAKPD